MITTSRRGARSARDNQITPRKCSPSPYWLIRHKMLQGCFCRCLPGFSDRLRLVVVYRCTVLLFHCFVNACGSFLGTSWHFMGFHGSSCESMRRLPWSLHLLDGSFDGTSVKPLIMALFEGFHGTPCAFTLLRVLPWAPVCHLHDCFINT